MEADRKRRCPAAGAAGAAATFDFSLVHTATKPTHLFARRNPEHCSQPAHLAAIIARTTLSELRPPRFYLKTALSDIVHETYGASLTVEFVYA